MKQKMEIGYYLPRGYGIEGDIHFFLMGET